LNLEITKIALSAIGIFGVMVVSLPLKNRLATQTTGKVFFMAVHGNMIKKLHSTTCTYFQKKQPDLNWENPEVKQTLFKMIYWWLERGIDGSVYAISHIQKQPGLPSLPNPKGEKYVSSFDYHMNVAGIEKHLHELKEQAFDPFNIVTVGEANGVTADNALLWVAEATEHDQGGVFNMIFSLNT
jgi:hypothetical protein